MISLSPSAHENEQIIKQNKKQNIFLKQFVKYPFYNMPSSLNICVLLTTTNNYILGGNSRQINLH